MEGAGTNEYSFPSLDLDDLEYIKGKIIRDVALLGELLVPTFPNPKHAISCYESELFSCNGEFSSTYRIFMDIYFRFVCRSIRYFC